MARMTTIMLSALSCSSLGACGDISANPKPDGLRQMVLTTATDFEAVKSALLLIDASAGRIVSRLELGGVVEGATSSPDGSTVYVAVVNSNARRELLAVDARAFEMRWRLLLSERLQAVPIDGVGIRSGEVLAVSTDGERLYTWRAARDSVFGIVTLDLVTRSPIAFSGPWNVAAGGMVPIPPTPTFPSGALVLVAGRKNAAGGPQRETSVFFLDPNSLAPIDSVGSDIVWGTQLQAFWEVVAAPGGHTLYVGGSHRLARYDIATRRVTASIPRPSAGAIALTPASGLIVVTDAGTRDFPGTGVLHLYGPDLESQGTIDVSTPLGGHPNGPDATVTGLAVAARDGRTLYVRAGTPSFGPLFSPQPARLLVVDMASRSLRRAVNLGGYGLGMIFVPPS